jgi:hypothetical protein
MRHAEFFPFPTQHIGYNPTLVLLHPNREALVREARFTSFQAATLSNVCAPIQFLRQGW